jgi:hypothetical protein
VGIITEDDKIRVQRMRSNFEKKIEKMFTFELKDEYDKKTKAEKKRIIINPDILEIAKSLFDEKELYYFKNEETLDRIGQKVKEMFSKDNGYFQIFAYIFEIYVWISKFKNKSSIQAIEQELAKKIRFLSQKHPPTTENTQVDKNLEFLSFPEKKFNLFT